MKKSFLFSFMAGLLCLACNNESTTRQSADSSLTVKGEAVARHPMACYAGHSGKDSVFMSLEETGIRVTGNMEYRFYEKDRSTGKFTGEMRGDTLLADYTYQSEGTSSTRQVAFLKQGDRLVEGYGDAEEKDGKLVFKNMASLQFGGGFVLENTNCK